VPLAPPTPGQIKVQLKRIGAQQAQLRVKLGEVTVQRLRLQVRRAEALAGGAEGAAPEGEAPAPEAEGGEAAPAPPRAAARLEAAKRQLRVMRVDAALSKLEVKAQKFGRLRWGGGVAFSAAPHGFFRRAAAFPSRFSFPTPASQPPPPITPPPTQRNKFERLRERRAALAPPAAAADAEEA
jgi:hypothetical protein